MELRSVESTHRIDIDDLTGLPLSLTVTRRESSRTALFGAALELEVGGTERRSATGGLEYVDTVRLATTVRTGEPRVQEGPNGRTWRVPVDIGGASGEILYRLNRFGPSISIGFDFVGRQAVIVRNVEFRGEIRFADHDWTLTAPGNGLQSAVALDALTAGVGISPVGGLRGSSGLVHLQSIPSRSGGQQDATVVWFDNDTELPEIEIRGTSGRSMAFAVTTNFAADLSTTTSNEIQLLSADIAVPRWSEFPAVFSGWLRARGLSSPGAPPVWVEGAMIYEAQIGYSIFGGTATYSPYPEITDLTKDLDRIRALGFSVIQLMPRQPYPSYNVHDYWDVDVSYGPRPMVIELVQQCHLRGMRIILDVLLHGVLDQESIAAAADGVRAGPFATAVRSETGDSFSSDVNDWNNYLIAWSRHILDFEPSWRAGSVPVSPLIAQHPDWFSRDSAGRVTGVYTKAFDVRNQEWQEYFTSAMCFLMTELGIDGFRFDAPTYNDFPNWSAWSRARAGSSALACVGLFERLRPVLKSLHAESLLYTEPSGHALRRSMDLNYNYDEQWLVTALGDPSARKPWGVQCAKGLATWMRDRDALLPAGSMTAHHIDSHDTFWWPSWGKKWRREQFTMEQFRVLTLIFASLPGPFMMFTGGEEGIEDLLPLVASVKTTPPWHSGRVSWWCGVDVPDSVFGMTRTLGSQSVSVVANFADAAARLDLSQVVVAPPTLRFSVGGNVELGSSHAALDPYSAVVFAHGQSVGR